MAWFPCNISGGGEPEIANILKGTSNPTSSIGDNGQLYLKYADLSLREYIEVGSTAGPYINTGFYWGSDCEFEIKAKWTDTPTNNTAFFGAYSPNMDTDVQVYNGNTLFYVGGSGTSSISIDTNDHIYKATQSELLLDGTNVGTPNWSRVPTSLEVSIFTMQQHSPAINARIYYIKIWKNGELHKYFIPAINNTTNEIGMFEAVSGKFYSNDGTGSFDISSSVISDMPSRPILSSFAKVNNAWQDLIGTDVDEIQSGGSGGSAIEDYTTNYLPCLLNNNYYTIFSKAANDEIYNGGRGGTRSSSNPVFYFCCKTTNDYWGYGLIGLTSASVQITSTTSYGDAVYYTQTTTNGNTVYLAKLGAMISGQSGSIFKNGYFEIDIDGSRYVGQDISTDLFDQTFIDAAYEALTALS